MVPCLVMPRHSAIGDPIILATVHFLKFCILIGLWNETSILTNNRIELKNKRTD